MESSFGKRIYFEACSQLTSIYKKFSKMKNSSIKTLFLFILTIFISSCGEATPESFQISVIKEMLKPSTCEVSRIDLSSIVKGTSSSGSLYLVKTEDNKVYLFVFEKYHFNANMATFRNSELKYPVQIIEFFHDKEDSEPIYDKKFQ